MTEQLGLFEARRGESPAELARGQLQVRESRRARYLTLRLLPPHTLELVVPHGTRTADVNAFVLENRKWIENARRELAACRPTRHEGLPATIELRAIGRQWRVEYQHDPAAPLRCRAGEAVLQVSTPDAERRGAAEALRRWLLDEADYHLVPWLKRESCVLERRPRSVQVRLQRTRWGSCSSSGTVSLNAALMFLEPPVVRYLFVHELCHLIALNHSHKFWNAVARYEPGYKALDRRLTEAWHEIPFWAHPEHR